MLSQDEHDAPSTLKLPSNGASIVGVCPVAEVAFTGNPVVTTAGAAAAAVACGRTTFLPTPCALRGRARARSPLSGAACRIVVPSAPNRLPTPQGEESRILVKHTALIPNFVKLPLTFMQVFHTVKCPDVDVTEQAIFGGTRCPTNRTAKRAHSPSLIFPSVSVAACCAHCFR